MKDVEQVALLGYQLFEFNQAFHSFDNEDDDVLSIILNVQQETSRRVPIPRLVGYVSLILPSYSYKKLRLLFGEFLIVDTYMIQLTFAMHFVMIDRIKLIE